MFHDLLAFLKEHIPLSTTSTNVFNASSIHMPFLLAIGIQFICGGFLLVFNSWTWGKFSLSIACWSNMPFCHFWSTFRFMIVVVFWVPTSKNLIVCVLVQLMVWLSFFIHIPRIQNVQLPFWKCIYFHV
jgi:hypothetical protein